MLSGAADAVIEEYFWDGHEYSVILQFLAGYHGIIISLNTLKRKLKCLGLSRKKLSPLLDVWNAVHQELRGPGKLGGYRTMWKCLQKQHHLTVSREMVRLILKQVDPDAVNNRRSHRLHRRSYSSRGPNDTWHIDGYDKLRPYGILITGCIDGFSRRIMWLQCGHSNHDPRIIAHHFVSCVLAVGGYPSHVRTDCGSENVVVAAIQAFVHNKQNAHIYGTSPGNQRIEAWWSFFRRHRSQFWIQHFETLTESGAYHPGHHKETECLRFCFMSLVQKDLNVVVKQWNTHRIRPSRGARCPAGVPQELFCLPQHPYRDCLYTTHAILPQELTNSLKPPQICEDNNFGNYLMYLCQFHNWHAPQTVESATALYFELIRYI